MNNILNTINVDIEHLFLMFIIFAFIGWLCEEVYCSIGERRFVYRGMLYGPICPIYGFGAVIIIFCLYPWKDTWIRLFFASVVLTSLLEYFVSWLLEKTFHAKWWDYSKHPFNIRGRVCLLNSVLFGLLGLALWHYAEPFVYGIVYAEAIQPYIHYIYLALCIILTVDILFTIRKLVDFNNTMNRFKLYAEHLKERFEGESWFDATSLHTMTASIRKKASEDSSKFSEKFLATLETYNEREKSLERWIKRFPSMTSADYSAQITHIKQMLSDEFSKQMKLLDNEKQMLKEKGEKLILGAENTALQAMMAKAEMESEIKEKQSEIKENIQEKKAEIKDELREKTAVIKDEIQEKKAGFMEKKESLKEKAADLKEKTEFKAEALELEALVAGTEMKESLKEELTEKKDNLKEKAETLKSKLPH